MSLRIAELCAGYSGLGMAVKSVLGGELAWTAEIDEDASKILAHRFPSVPNYGDITTADWPSIEPPDVFCAGFPCQPVSLAGKRLGEADERWIWPAVAGAVRDLRPGLVFLENVSALVVRGLAGVAADLAQIGYVGSWCCLRASDVGACHRRERVFILARPAAAHAGSERRDGRARLGRDGWPAPVGQQAGRNGRDSRSSPAKDPDRATGREWREPAPGQAAAGRPRPDTGGSGGAPAADSERDGLEGQRRDARARAGRSAAPARGCGPAGSDRAAADPEMRRRDDRVQYALEPGAPGRGSAPAGDAGGGDLPAADADCRGFEELEELDSRTLARVSGTLRHDAIGPVLDWGIYTLAIRRHERAFGRPAPRPTEPGRTGERLSPRFVEWMQGLPEGWVTDVPGLSRNAQLKALGNGVVPAQAAMALRLLLDRADIPSLVAADWSAA